MAANKSNTVSRREREQRTRRTERMVIIGAAGVLAVATVVVLVGLYVTQYLPPRAHVLTVGESEYNAGEVAAAPPSRSSSAASHRTPPW